MCAGCGLGDGRVAPVYAKCSVISLSTEKHNGFGILYPDASRCPQMLADASRCLQMPPRCLQMPPRCLQMPPDASRCLKMPPDASRYLQMPPEACKCFQMLPDTSQMRTHTQTSSHRVNSAGDHKRQLFGVARRSHINITSPYPNILSPISPLYPPQYHPSNAPASSGAAM